VGWVSPYFYEEDEAHHFNRTIEMMKTGDLNPHYFHKPALHFYLRLPFAMVAFLNEVRQGRARTVDELVTRDGVGVGGYAFGASHPGVVKALRLVSVFCLIGIVFSVYAVIFLLTQSLGWSVYGAFLTLGSSLLFRYGGEVGVDVVAGLCVILTCTFARLSRVKGGRRGFYVYSAVAAFCSGLAVGAKYNAVPIIAVPVLNVLMAPRNLQFKPSVQRDGFLIGVVLFIVGVAFVCCNPFVFFELPLFLNQVGYEVWHYGIAGHEGHTSEPGWRHLYLYLCELAAGDYGLIVVLVGCIGMAILVWNGEFLLVIFPLLYLAYMAEQRAHFMRNLVAVVPFFAIATTYLCYKLFGRYRSLACLVAILALFEAYGYVFYVRQSYILDGVNESRILAADWLREQEKGENNDVIFALDRDLQFDPSVRRAKGRDRSVDLTHVSFADLYLSGYAGILFSLNHRSNVSDAEIANIWSKHGKGVSREDQRVVKNPWIGVVNFDDTWTGRNLHAIKQAQQVLPEVNSVEWQALIDQEGWVWVQKKLAELRLATATFQEKQGVAKRLRLQVMSPWFNQRLVVNSKEACVLKMPYEWQVCEFEVIGHEIELVLSKVGFLTTSNDKRVLGVAIKEVALDFSEDS
jgi:hypothetical protein